MADNLKDISYYKGNRSIRFQGATYNDLPDWAIDYSCPDRCNPLIGTCRERGRHYYSLFPKIISAKEQLNKLDNGTAQRDYVFQERDLQDKSRRVSELDFEIEKAKKILYAWENNPEMQWGYEGLGGWFRDCTHHKHQIQSMNQNIPLLEAELNATLQAYKERSQRYSSENLKKTKEQISLKNKEIQEKEAILKDITARIEEERRAYKIKKDAEEIAVASTREAGNQNEDILRRQREQESKRNTYFLIGALGLGLMLLLGGSDAKKVSV